VFCPVHKLKADHKTTQTGICISKHSYGVTSTMHLANLNWYCGQQSSSQCHLHRRKQKTGKYFTTEELPYVLSCLSLHIHTLKQTLIVKFKNTHCISICNFMYRKNSISLLWWEVCLVKWM